MADVFELFFYLCIITIRLCGMSAVHIPVNQHLLTNQEFRIKQHCGINIVTDVIKIMNHHSNARNASIDIIKSSRFFLFFFYTF